MAEFKPNMQQHPIDIAKDYNEHEAAEQHMEATPDEPEEFSKKLVRRGVIDPRTGLPTGNSKQQHLSNWTPSKKFQAGYDQINWEHKPTRTAQ